MLVAATCAGAAPVPPNASKCCSTVIPIAMATAAGDAVDAVAPVLPTSVSRSMSSGSSCGGGALSFGIVHCGGEIAGGAVTALASLVDCVAGTLRRV